MSVSIECVSSVSIECVRSGIMNGIERVCYSWH